ncbi:mevalonate kinase [Scheffersomyces xylosifermentans]|uniref:mevalonate kinase n=1 Tax=Scheffersomyces xylosifermentans TaxID=1304137 RepID=UPI00315D81AE
MSESSFFVSAPGKVIIFGEHSAVYGKPAIAAALSLRAYLLITPSKDVNTLKLDFPDIGLSHSWNKNDIPWEEIRSHVKLVDGRPQITEELIPEIVDNLGSVLSNLNSTLHYTACLCFLYLYTQLCNKDIPGMSFCIRSTLPIGAGLGSSASTAVCLATSLAILGDQVERPSYGMNEKSTKKESTDLDFIDSWSLMGEKCFHGNPSGIDNAVATHGGAVMFQRMSNPAQPSVRTTMRNFPPIKLLLTNTKVPRSTAELVGGVSRVNSEYPKTSSSILDAMEHLSTNAYQIMVRPFFGKEERKTLRELVNINHGLLVALGVSHPSLEKVKIISDTWKLGATKLTGAGGGGCAITLVDDDVTEEVIEKGIAEFEKEGFDTFETSLGGKGVGALAYSDVPEELRERIFSPEVFCAYSDRLEIENALSTDNLTGWRFW